MTRKHCRYCRGGAVDLLEHEENCVMNPANQPTDPKAQIVPPYRFARYVNGERMAEGVTIKRADSFDDAIREAAKLCPEKGAVLVALAHSPSPPAEDGEVAAMVEAIARRFCSERCAECGEGPCYEIDRNWMANSEPEVSCDCVQMATIAAGALARLNKGHRAEAGE